MRAVVQRVTSASVRVDGVIVGSIEQGLLVLLGVEPTDTTADVAYLADKTVNLRIFADDDDKMNLSVIDIGGAVLAVSQFTLLGDCRKGRRPAFTGAAPPELANALYEEYVTAVRQLGPVVETGVFRAQMEVSLLNDGPITLLLDSRKQF